MSAPVAIDPADLATKFWWYPARPREVSSTHLSAVVDGDTLWLDVSCGFHIAHTLDIRVRGVNAPEMHGATADAGAAARDFVMAWLNQHVLGCAPELRDWPLAIKSLRLVNLMDDQMTFSRYVADIYDRTTGASLGADLLASGNAVLFMEG